MWSWCANRAVDRVVAAAGLDQGRPRGLQDECSPNWVAFARATVWEGEVIRPLPRCCTRRRRWTWCGWCSTRRNRLRSAQPTCSRSITRTASLSWRALCGGGVARKAAASARPRAGPGSTCGWRLADAGGRRTPGRSTVPASGSTATAINMRHRGSPSAAAMCTTGGRPAAVRPSARPRHGPPDPHRIRATTVGIEVRDHGDNAVGASVDWAATRIHLRSVSSPARRSGVESDQLSSNSAAVSVGRPRFGAGCGDVMRTDRSRRTPHRLQGDHRSAGKARPKFLGSTAVPTRRRGWPRRRSGGGAAPVDPAFTNGTPPLGVAVMDQRRRSPQRRHRAIVRQRAQATEADIRAAEPELVNRRPRSRAARAARSAIDA